MQMKTVGKWNKATKLLEDFPEKLRERVNVAMKAEEPGLFAAVQEYLARAPGNKQLTLLLKELVKPMSATGYSVQSSNFRLTWKRKQNQITALWGVPAGRAVPKNAGNSKFKRLAPLLEYLHGGSDLENPKAELSQKVTPQMARLFAIVRRRQLYRAGRKHRKKAGAPLKRLTGRADQLSKMAKGRLLGPQNDDPKKGVLKAGTILKTKSRPFMLRAYRARKSSIYQALKKAIDEAVKESTRG